MTHHYLACDLGAESGRLVLGSLNESGLSLEELHRFNNTPRRGPSSLTWDMAALFAGLKEGLQKTARLPGAVTSISCDSWGLDYVLFDQTGRVLEPVYHYRDARTAIGWRNVFSRLSRETIFAETGIQFMEINTVYQLASEPSVRLEQASALLNIADAFNFFLSGRKGSERSLASTTQLYNPVSGEWSARLMNALGLPRRLFQPLIESGTTLGPLLPELAAGDGLAGTRVVASCSHDTGAAVAGVPAEPGPWAYLSSGTWSLLGVEIAKPLLTERCRELNFTNEIGFGNTVRLLKNLAGLWVVQECRRAWAECGAVYDYEELTRMAAQSGSARSLVDLTDPRFLGPGEMPEKIVDFCRETNQESPEAPGGIIRCVLESLALLYRKTVRELEELTGQRIERLHIVGGGSKNRLLNQLTANALQIPVICGPVEATAAGNILVQAIAAGQIESLPAARRLLKASAKLDTVEPKEGGR